jgi:hypothetical protein
MEHDHLIGQVQHRARLASRGEAEVAVRATLQTLEERISEGIYQNLIAQLPQGIAITKTVPRSIDDDPVSASGSTNSLSGSPDARASGSKTQPFMPGACLRSSTRPPQAEPRAISRRTCRRTSGHYLRLEAKAR